MRRATGAIAAVAAMLSVVGVGCSSSGSSLARDCRGHDLTVDHIESEGVMSRSVEKVQLRNTSSSTCSMADYPTSVTGTSDAGSSVIAVKHPTFVPSPKPGNLRPGQSGMVILETSAGCLSANASDPTGPIYRDVQLFVPGGGVVSLDKLTLDARCGVTVSPLGVKQ